MQQPWAWSIFRAGKNVENRRNVRGPAAAAAQFAALAGTTVLIQASGKYAGAEAFEEIRRLNADAAVEPGQPGRDPAWDFGAILGVATIGTVHVSDDCQPAYTGVPGGYWCSKWAWPNAAHLQITSTRLLTTPVVHPGRLGIWSVTDALALSRIRKGLAA